KSFFTRNEASGGAQRLRHKKVSREIAVADVFFKRCSDRVVMVRLHERRRMCMISAKCERICQTRVYQTRCNPSWTNMPKLGSEPKWTISGSFCPRSDKEKIRAAHAKEKQRIEENRATARIALT